MQKVGWAIPVAHTLVEVTPPSPYSHVCDYIAGLTVQVFISIMYIIQSM